MKALDNAWDNDLSLMPAFRYVFDLSSQKILNICVCMIQVF